MAQSLAIFVFCCLAVPWLFFFGTSILLVVRGLLAIFNVMPDPPQSSWGGGRIGGLQAPDEY